MRHPADRVGLGVDCRAPVSRPSPLRTTPPLAPHELEIPITTTTPEGRHRARRTADRAPIRWFRASAEAQEDDGLVFLLIHGVGLSHRSFSRLARELVVHGPVLAPDLPGFGFARGARRRASIEQMAAALLPALDRHVAGSRRLVVLGHSLGAEVAVEVARLRPELTRGVVLVGPVVDPHAASAFGQARRLLLDMWHEPPMTGAMVGRDYVRGGLLSFAAGVTSMLRYEIADRISSVAAPVLVLRGARDPVAPAPWADELAGLAVDGQTADVPHAVHNVVHSHPQAVARHVAAFARQHSPAGM
jgi:pimeloyl-ACP methyl ester carboxylesterase